MTKMDAKLFDEMINEFHELVKDRYSKRLTSSRK